MKAIEQNFPVLLFIMLYKVVLTFAIVDEVLWMKCDHSDESVKDQQYFSIVLFNLLYCAVQFLLLRLWVKNIKVSGSFRSKLRPQGRGCSRDDLHNIILERFSIKCRKQLRNCFGFALLRFVIG